MANRRLREQNPQAQQLLELEEQLRQSLEENVHFVQEISESGRGQAGGSYVPEEDPAVQAELSQTKEANSRLSSEAEELHQSVEELTAELSQKQVELERATQREQEAEENADGLQRELGRAQDAAELERLRWVAEETREWEQREARLVGRVEDLERNTLPASKPTAVTEGAGSYETRPTEQTAACINQREMLMTGSSGKEASQELTAGEQGLRYTGVSVMTGDGSKGEVLSGPESGVGLGTTSGYTASTSQRRANLLNLAVP